jgi:hypothetical protein
MRDIHALVAATLACAPLAACSFEPFPPESQCQDCDRESGPPAPLARYVTARDDGSASIGVGDPRAHDDHRGADARERQAAVLREEQRRR